MTNSNRIVGGQTETVKVPVAANIAISVGDVLFKNTTNGSAIPASGLSFVGTMDDNIGQNRLNFLGVSADQHLSTEGATNINVVTRGFARFDASGVLAASGIGVAMTLASGVGKILNDTIVYGASNSGSLFTLAENLSAATTDNQQVKVFFQSNIYRNV